MNTDNFLIKEEEIEIAQNICKTISNADIRNRAIANALAANIAVKFFENEQSEVDSVSGLHNISTVLEDIDISDIYIKGCYIDVRLYFNDNELAVPKAHFTNNLLPVAYMFIRINSDLSGASVTGFVLPENINQSNEKDGLFFIEENDLASFYDIETNIINVEDPYSIEDEQIFAYLDNTIKDKFSFYRNLISSKDGRLRLAKAEKAQHIFNFVSVAKPAETEVEEVELSANDSFDMLADSNNDDFLLEENSLESFNLEESDGIDNSIDSLEELHENNSIELDLHEEEIPEISNEFDNILDIEDNQSDDIQELSLTEDNSLQENTLDIQEEPEEIVSEVSLDISEDTNEFALDQDDLNVEEQSAEIEPEELEQKPQVFASIADLDFSSGVPTAKPESNIENDSTEDNIQEDSDNTIISDLFDSEPEQENDSSEENSFDFSTATTPSLDDTEVSLDELLNEDEESVVQEETEEEEEEEEEENNDSSGEENSSEEQLETLFNSDEIETEPQFDAGTKKTNGAFKLFLIIGFLAIVGAIGYFGVTKFGMQSLPEEDSQNNLVSTAEQAEDVQPEKSVQEAMPIETVEAELPKNASNEGTAVSIPMIEQNLDASIIVSNLQVAWEVPAGYASNTSAKRYLTKLGKIIQLNLKTELLLLSKPPITNKIGVEIKYNNSDKKFEAVGITTSSGEKSVDDIILQTVNKALGMNLSTNTDSFNKLQGNPILIIRL